MKKELTVLDVLEGLKMAADIHKTTKINLLKYTHPDLLVAEVNRMLGNVYEMNDVFNALRDTVKIVFSDHYDDLPFIGFWRIGHQRKSAKMILDETEYMIGNFLTVLKVR